MHQTMYNCCLAGMVVTQSCAKVSQRMELQTHKLKRLNHKVEECQSYSFGRRPLKYNKS